MTTHSVFDAYNQEVAESVAKTKAKITQEKQRPFIALSDYVFKSIEQDLQTHVQQALSLSATESALLEMTPAPDHITADVTVATFNLAKARQQNPAETATQIAERLKDNSLPFITSVSLAGPYLNIELNKALIYDRALQQITELGDRYGESDIHAHKVMVIDFSHPNIAKPIGVGHLRSTVIGEALSNLYYKTGYSVVKDNHLGDWGTQFGSLLYAFELWGDEEKLKENPIIYLKDLYVRFHAAAQNQPELEDKARERFQQLEHKAPELVKRWKEFRDLSLDDFMKTYRLLRVSFDTYIGESYFENQTQVVVDEALDKNLATLDPETQAVIVKDLDSLPTFILQKSDGASLYITRDLATIKFRVAEFAPETLLYVVGAEQELNFKQLFALAKKLGYLGETTAKHISFGMVLSDGKKMSTRRGTLIELDELIQQSIQKSKELLQSKGSTLSEAELNEAAEMIGVGALLYNDLRQSRVKNISFDWERMLDFEGGSAVYLQYTYARIQSILRQAGDVTPSDTHTFTEMSEFALAKKLMLFPLVIAQAQATDYPHMIAVYLEELAQLFNSFYNEVPILKTEDTVLRNSRLRLIHSVAHVIKLGLGILNIQTPEKM